MYRELSEVLHRLRLTEYLPVLLENGFDSWAVICDITEDDLAKLGFKLNHRRVLQHEIVISRGLLHDQPQESDSSTPTPHNVTAPEDASSAHSTSPPDRKGPTKRRYRLKPRPDINAPKKPRNAYTNFACTLRTEKALRSLSFTEMAREVGRRWRGLAPEEKHAWKSRAAQAMHEYKAQMDEYKLTENYRSYQHYLKSFLQDQAQGKRSTALTISSIEDDHEYRGNSAETISVNCSETARWHSQLRKSEECEAAISSALQELATKRDQVLALGVPVYDSRTLPAEDIIRKAARSCCLGTGSLMFLVGQEQLENLLDHVYGRGSIEPLALVMVLIVAAIGARYDFDCVSDSMRQGLYASAMLIFDRDLARSDLICATQILLLFSVYSLLEERMAVRPVVAAALEISRRTYHSLRDEVADESDRDNTRRIVCTLIFIDCWLSTRSGYRSAVTHDDVTRALSPAAKFSTDAIYLQASTISLIFRNIADIIVQKAPNAVKIEHIEPFTEKLDAWYKALPPIMHLAALTDNAGSLLTPYQRRSILMVHMFHLGTIISLYRQLLLNASRARIQSTCDIDMNYSQVQYYGNRCLIAARLMARMMTLVGFGGATAKRCWLMIYWSFHSCIVLLFNVAQQMLNQEQDSLDHDLAYAKICVDILVTCSSAEPVAMAHLDIVRPLYNWLWDQQKRSRANGINYLTDMQTSSRTYPSSAATTPNATCATFVGGYAPETGNNVTKQQPSNAEIVSIANTLSHLLGDPFEISSQEKI